MRLEVHRNILYKLSEAYQVLVYLLQTVKYDQKLVAKFVQAISLGQFSLEEQPDGTAWPTYYTVRKITG